MRILGIDPGKDGGLVLIERSPLRVLEAERMGTFLYVVKGGKRDYDRFHLLAFIVDAHPSMIVLERQQPMTRRRQGKGGEPARPEGVTSTFSSGFGFGVLAMAATAADYMRSLRSAEHRIDLVDVQPSVWAAAMLKGVRGEGKHRAVTVAKERLPDLNLLPGHCRKPHQGLADAGCLALYGRQVLATAIDKGDPRYWAVAGPAVKEMDK